MTLSDYYYPKLPYFDILYRLLCLRMCVETIREFDRYHDGSNC